MSRAIGQISEELAADYLVKKGYNIIAKNINYSFGELDIVAKHNKTLVFVEVKMRKNLAFGFPYEAVTRSKQRKIIMAAQAFLKKYKNDYFFCRFDVVSILGEPPQVQVSHIEDAFCLES